MQYIVIKESNFDLFIEKVNSKIEEGYIHVGGCIYVENYFLQTLSKLKIINK